MIYLVKVGDSLFEYEKVGDYKDIKLSELNKFITERTFPILSGNDIQMLKNSGGTVVCKTPSGEIVWLVNIDHQQDEKIGVILGEELVLIITNIISRIKRDLTLNEIL
jgi:hypothetical protein